MATFTEDLAPLRRMHANLGAMDMRKAFAADPQRFGAFSASHDGLLVDWSKCLVDTHAMAGLMTLAKARGVAEHRDSMFAGEPVNNTEMRAVLHTALRNRSGTPVMLDGADVMPGVQSVLAAMGAFAEGLRTGSIAAANGARFTDVINIGIGGSDLGPVMATAALAPYHDGPRLHFVSNVDGAHMADTLKRLDPATTLVIIASKTFTTIETMTNARTARRWIAGRLGETAVAKHFAAISTALDKVSAFGIGAERTFGFWDWVGGRYSVWSAIGLPVMIAIGARNFGAFLDGAFAMDTHFRNTAPDKNLPVILGLLGIWHRNVMGHATRAIIPYDQRLHRLPAYLQQLDMESNGKRVARNGEALAESSGPVIWGEPGTNGQHAFFQLLHQGSDVIPVEFIVGAKSHEPELDVHQELLLANCLAQSEALMRGRTRKEAHAQLKAMGKSDAEATRLAPHRVFPGNRPSITILYEKLDPKTLGQLIALYEHRVFVEAAVWGINAFDQWGVELGKELATDLQPVVEGRQDAAGRDGSTAGLVSAIRRLRTT